MALDAHKWPRLSGTLSYGQPHYWEFIFREKSIEVVPRTISRGLMAFFALVGLIPLLASPWIINWLEITSGKYWVYIIACIFEIFMAGFCTLLYLAGNRELRLGPVLAVNLDDREVRLPRENKTWKFDDVVKWEIVYGTSVRADDGTPRRFGDVISELQLVVRNAGGELAAWPLIGTLGSPKTKRALPAGIDLYKSSAELAAKTGIPLEINE